MTTPPAKLIYLAAPYSDPDPRIVLARMYAFDAVVADLLREGASFPISPLMNHSILGRHTIPGNWEFWQHYSRRLLARCDELMIIELPGWDQSVGVQGELELAKSLSLPITRCGFSYEEFLRGRRAYANTADASPQV